MLSTVLAKRYLKSLLFAFEFSLQQMHIKQMVGRVPKTYRAALILILRLIGIYWPADVPHTTKIVSANYEYIEMRGKIGIQKMGDNRETH